MGVSERSNKTRRRTLRAVSAKESAHADHASQEAVRPLTCRLLDPLPLPLPPQHHSTALPSPKRYDNLYEEKFLRDIRPHQLPRDHEDMGVAPRMWKWGIQACSPASV